MVAINIRLHSFRLTAITPATLPNSLTLHASCTTGRLPATVSPTLTTTSETTASLPVDWKLEWAERLPDRLALRAAALRLRVTHKPRHRLGTIRCLPPPQSSCPPIGCLKLDLLSLARGTVAYSLRLRDPSGAPTPYVLAFDVIVEQPARVPLTLSQIELRHSRPYSASALFVAAEYSLSGVVARSSLLPIIQSDSTTNSSPVRHNWKDPITLLLHAPNLGDLVHSSVMISLHDAHEPPDNAPIAHAKVPTSAFWAAFSRPRSGTRVRIQLSDGSALLIRVITSNCPPSAQLVGGVTTDDAITGARPVIFGTQLADMARVPVSPDLPNGWVRLIDTIGYEYYHHVRSRVNVWTIPPDQTVSGAIRADESRARALGYERTRHGVFRSIPGRSGNDMRHDVEDNQDGNSSEDLIENDHQNDVNPIRQDRRLTENQEVNDDEIIEVWAHPAARMINVPSFDAPDDGSSITINQDADMSPRTSISLSTIDPMELHPAAYTTRFKSVYIEDESLEMSDSMNLAKEGLTESGGRSSTSSGSAAVASGSDVTNNGDIHKINEGANVPTTAMNAAAKLGQGRIVEMKWEQTKTPTLDVGTEGHTLTAVNGGRTLLKFGGTVHASRTNALFAFDVETMQWSAVQAQGVIPQARAGHGAVAIGADRGRLLTFGGLSPQGRLNDLHTFHVERGIWSPVTAMGTPPAPRGRLGMTASTDGATAFVFGGRSLYRYLGGRYYDSDCVNAFIAERSQWIQMTPRGPGPRPSPRSGCVVEFFNDRHMLVHGGYLDGEQYFDDTFIFDIASSSWHKVPYPNDGVRPSTRESHASTVLGSQIVIYGGDSPRGLLSDLHIFDTNLLRWRRSPDLVGHGPGKVCGSAMAATYDNRIIHVGGDIGFQMSRSTHSLDVSHCSAVDAEALKELAEGRGPDAGACVVCLDEKVETIFLWCGHSVCCRSCSKMLKQMCPVCRKPFSKIMYSSFEQSNNRVQTAT